MLKIAIIVLLIISTGCATQDHYLTFRMTKGVLDFGCSTGNIGGGEILAGLFIGFVSVALAIDAVAGLYTIPHDISLFVKRCKIKIEIKDD